MGVLQIHPHCLGLNVPLLAKCPPVGYSESEVSEMDGRQMGALLSKLRRERGMTQGQTAELLHVSAQAVSKWERGQGCPDVSLLPSLAGIFGVSVERLLTGDLAPETADGGNMKRLKFYVCPDCGNILTVTGGGEIHCCGRKLRPLEARHADADHSVRV